MTPMTPMTTMTTDRTNQTLAAVLALNIAFVVFAQSPSEPIPPSVPTPPAEKSIDELLGIGDSDAKKADDESARADKASLQRILSDKEAQNALEATIGGMHRSAELLAENESGTAVQRIQEDILARLDTLIQSAQQQQQQSSSSSSSSSSSGKSSGSKKSSEGKQGGKATGESKSGASEAQRRAEAQERAAAKKSADQQGNDPASPSPKPGGEGADGTTPETDSVEGGIIDETDEEWGSLPARTRESLRQGIREKMSSVYRRWTEAYYRRIAEEARP